MYVFEYVSIDVSLYIYMYIYVYISISICIFAFSVLPLLCSCCIAVSVLLVAPKTIIVCCTTKDLRPVMGSTHRQALIQMIDLPVQLFYFKLRWPQQVPMKAPCSCRVSTQIPE